MKKLQSKKYRSKILYDGFKGTFHWQSYRPHSYAALMNHHTVCVRRIRVAAVILLMAYSGAYARDLTKRALPTKPLVYCSEISPRGFAPSTSEAGIESTVQQRSSIGCWNTNLKIRQASNLVSPNAGKFQKMDEIGRASC